MDRKVSIVDVERKTTGKYLGPLYEADLFKIATQLIKKVLIQN